MSPALACPLRPQEQRKADDGRAHDEQRHALRGAVDRAAHPGAPRAAAPLGDDLGEARVLAGLRTEGLHHRVAADGVGERAAELGVPGVAEPRRRRDVAERQRDRQPDIGERAGRDDQAHHRPGDGEQHGRTDQHDQRRQQRHQDRVVQQVERPHAARDLAHGRAGEAVGVPVGREALNAMESVRADVGHHLQRQLDDAHEAEVPQHGCADRKPDQRGEGCDRQRSTRPGRTRCRSPPHLPAGRHRAASARRRALRPGRPP